MPRKILARVVLCGPLMTAALPAQAALYEFTFAGSGYSGTGLITTSSTLVPNISPCPGCAVGPGYEVIGVSGA